MKKLGVVVLALALTTGVYARGGGGGHGGGGHASGHAAEGGAHESISGHAEEEAPHIVRPIYVAHGVAPESVCKDGVDKVDDSASQVAVTCKEKSHEGGVLVAAFLLFSLAIIGAIVLP